MVNALLQGRLSEDGRVGRRWRRRARRREVLFTSLFEGVRARVVAELMEPVINETSLQKNVGHLRWTARSCRSMHRQYRSQCPGCRTFRTRSSSNCPHESDIASFIDVRRLHSLLSLLIEPIREHGHTGPDGTEEWTTIVCSHQPNIGFRTTVERAVALSRKVRDRRIRHENCNGAITCQ